ncbi:hypothetical protein [Rhizobium sp. ICMP 5592]|uniref:hypothetical protein n=1 Tax=Rhizobium sp. ICMP 5592 TaxID=2292445 RepID=UPI0025705B05|nr:hypothetical protein [Rhizobium sp. ICMP 5592]
MPPHRYLINLRLDFAEKLLIKGEITIAEIAYMSRFSGPKPFGYHDEEIQRKNADGAAVREIIVAGFSVGRQADTAKGRSKRVAETARPRTAMRVPL